jgi:hypothetical protein
VTLFVVFLFLAIYNTGCMTALLPTGIAPK